jgi:ribonuclease P protein component
VKRSFRLTGSKEYERVRRTGKSYAHPLIVLIALRSETQVPRFAVSASRAVGKAVRRNRAKRVIREAIRPLIASISPGWDVVLLARQPILAASFEEVHKALVDLLSRAKLFTSTDTDG